MTDILSTKQTKAIAALLELGEITAAAEAAGVNRTTLHRWRQEPAFAQALKNAEAEAVAGVSRRLTTLSTQALSTISNIMTDPTTPPALQLRAADIVLARLLAIRELVDLEARIATLEASLAAEGAAGGAA